MSEVTKKTGSQVVSDFLTSQKKVLFTVLVIIVCSIIAFGVYSGINNKKQNEVVNVSIELDSMLSKLTRSEITEADFTKFTIGVIKDYKNTKAELAVYSALGSYYFDQSNFEKSLENYTLAYTKFPKDMANSVNMFNAAMCQEELGKKDQAIKLLEELVAKFKNSDINSDINSADLSSDVPEAIFSLGRLYETTGDIDKAVNNYEILVAEYQSYNLSNLAKSRLITIK